MPQSEFPTRKYPYSREARAVQAAPLPLAVHAMVVGLDNGPRRLPAEELPNLDDPFGRLLRAGIFPMTGRELLTALDRRAILPAMQLFVVGDDGQIPWTAATAGVNRTLRIAITRSAAPGTAPDVLISTSTGLGDAGTFLQVIGWDDTHGVFHYYERRLGIWLWAGDSRHALLEPTRGRGPFDSHVNGAMVMKELKSPWTHWNSEAAKIQDDVLAPGDPIAGDPLWIARANASIFEQQVARAGLSRWNSARFAAAIRDGVLYDARTFLRQLLTTTTVNLASTSVESRRVATHDSLTLPRTFFTDSDAFENVLELELDLPEIRIDSVAYLQELGRVRSRLWDGGDFQQAGETHFAFLVPERALEDQIVVAGLLARAAISPRLAGCLLAVDLANPIYSSPRETLFAMAPDELPLDGGATLENTMIAAAQTAGPGHPAATQLLELWAASATVGWQRVVGDRLGEYMRRAAARARTAEGVRDLVRLADGRRCRFRRSTLAEFKLTLPFTDLVEAETIALRMSTIGTVL